MAKIDMYTTTWCPYCVRAKALLKELKQEFNEFNIETDEGKRDEMAQRAPGFTSVPQIFIDDFHVGGCDDLYALHNKGELEKLLN
jgi:glutaredoxin 3